MTPSTGDSIGDCPGDAAASACPIALDQAFYTDPHPTYRVIKQDGNTPTEIVLKTGMAYLPPGLRAWLVTSYADVEFVLRDERFRKDISEAMPLFSARSGQSRSEGRARSSLLYDNMANNDPPKHTRLRRPLNANFTARAVSGKRQDIWRVATETLDAVAGQETFDLVRDYAFPFSIAVICDTLGVPRQDRRSFDSWVQSITGDAAPDVLQQDVELMTAYLRDLIKRKRAGTDEDVLTHLARSLEPAEAVAQAYALLAAGYETTANLIVTGVLTLKDNPEQKRRLWADPSLAPRAVEEMLRHQSPFNLSLYRYTTEDVEVGGVKIPAHSILFLSFAAANRDDARFPDPDTFDIARARQEHLAFGGGIHNCIGKHLARTEAEIAFEALARRCPDLSVRTPLDRFDWKASPTFRGLRSLVVGPGPAASAAV
ncbi:cytochrome P450 [Streptomyces sp. NPDC023723]|uniref:cytochrome P450 family protein n=1 Tax=Streptomyces sp. NPDC023723 TaxID=3154323 RepID=UPI0033F09056